MADTPVDGVIDTTFGWALKLAEVGPLGLGVLIFASVFLVLIVSIIFKASITTNVSSLVKQFMMLGTLCFVISLAANFASTFFSASHKLTLVFSPDLEVIELPPPTIFAGDRSQRPRLPFAIVRDTQIKIGMDSIIRQVQGLETSFANASTELATANSELTVVTNQLATVRTTAATQQQLTARLLSLTDSLTNRPGLPLNIGNEIEGVSRSLRETMVTPSVQMAPGSNAIQLSE